MRLLDRPDLDVVAWHSETQPCDRKWLFDNIPGATGILLLFSEKVDNEFLDAAGPSLKVISTMSVGYVALSARNQAWFTPDVLTEAVADITVMLALMAGRNIKETSEIVQKGQWSAYPWAPYLWAGSQLSASWVHPARTAGFLGFGRIAQSTLARLLPFGYTRALYTGNPTSQPNPARDAELLAKYAPHGLAEFRRVDLAELARESDVVFVLAPGGPSTYHVVNEAFLKGMKKTAVLVNTSRGVLVDSEALAKACREGWIWGAGVDVVEGEPNVPADHPLLREPRCVVLPHIGSATNETRLGMATMAINNVIGGALGGNMPAELNMSR
ncbi:D-isomer specific 2-hydroxyacid dehydrogenase [Fomitopsis serialis]|uniref:D-isomer specific 2-hydroxyacid dehydrogenase n=1 Tax=Fomitopsis serialis TaxID=139415 RepID=UPI0020076B3A|nr:D-isomer specific 2-hydroxyacid dehydrogenase [Neoantrodia serialis]KAH9913107.1 D-isomer specific 2-hydroxyacid dehydrogenase [Neoantrodia serialis]